MSLSVRTALQALHLETIDAARKARGMSRPCSARELFGSKPPPSALQFRLRYFMEHRSTDDTLQGASDEVYISALGADSSTLTIGPDLTPQFDLVRAGAVGDVSEDSVRGPWRQSPHVLVEYDLRRPGDWPRTYSTTLLIVEHDNEDIAKAFEVFYSVAGDAIRGAAVSAAAAAGAKIGAVIGSSVPLVGTAIGAGIGALAGVAFGEVAKLVQSGLANDIFTPIPIVFTIDTPWVAASNPDAGVERTQTVREHGAHYDIVYDWHIVP